MKWNKGQKTSKFKVLSVASVICLLLPVILLVTSPAKLMAKYQLRLSHGSLLWNLMQEEMEAVYVRCYLFNVTNADAFLAGEDDKLRVADVGPFTYQEFRRMEDQELDEAEGLMRFTLRTRSRFVPEKSIGDPRDINVTSSNMISLAVASKISTYPYFVKAGFNVLMNSIKSKSIINESAYNLLWGFNDPLLGVGRTVLPFIDYNSLGILNRLFDTKLRTRIEMVISGEDKFRIKSVNNLPGLTIRGYGDTSKRSKCNTYDNIYEGIGFPTDLNPEKPLPLFRDVLCRLLDLEYVGTEKLSYGPLALKYRLDKRTYSITNDTECLCNKFCIDGLTDMSPCFYDLGVAVSNAHFLDTNPSLYKRIVGMHPDENRHGSDILIDSLTGMVLKTKFSLQINVVTEDLSFNKNFKSFSNMVVPIAFFEVEQPEVPEDSKKQFYVLNIISPYVLHGLEVIFVVLGAGLLAFILYTKIWQNFNPDRNIAYHLPRSIIFEKMDSI